MDSNIKPRRKPTYLYGFDTRAWLVDYRVDVAFAVYLGAHQRFLARFFAFFMYCETG
jgi:hypothetical protein